MERAQRKYWSSRKKQIKKIKHHQKKTDLIVTSWVFLKSYWSKNWYTQVSSLAAVHVDSFFLFMFVRMKLIRSYGNTNLFTMKID